MVSKEFEVRNPEGFHLRPATKLCKVAAEYDCIIEFRIRNTRANAKSMLSVLAAQVKQGDKVTFYCNGQDETDALQAIGELLEHNMDMSD